MKRFCIVSVMLLCTMACSHGAEQSHLLDTIRTKSELHTFTGITRRIEFKHASSDELVRLEIQRITTGRKVLGETGVRVDEAGQWLMYDLSNNKITARFKPANTQAEEACNPAPNAQSKTVLFADFVDDGTKWRAEITRIYELPKPMLGITTESESAVNIIACKLKN